MLRSLPGFLALSCAIEDMTLMRKPYDDDIRRQPVMSQALAELIAEKYGVHPAT
jgi:hypothetical protein